MTVMKEIQLPVSIRWRGGSVVRADSPDRKPLELATSPRFQAVASGYWSPEDLLVVSTASSFVLTLATIAEWRETPLLDATVSSTGHMSQRDDGRFGLTVIEINAELETIPGREAEVEAAAKAAEERCLVRHALDVPVHVAVSVRTASGSPSTTSRSTRQSMRPSMGAPLPTRS